MQHGKNDERKNITINDLLHMNSGLEWEERYDKICDATQMLFIDEDMTKSQIDKPLVGNPIKLGIIHQERPIC